MPLSRRKGFTLAELLIALAILGVIATFTIPKVLQAQQDTAFKAKAKEAAAMISGAYDAYKLKNGAPTASTKTNDILAFMNYIKVDTASTLDNVYTATSDTCTPSFPCLVLHNGATLLYTDNQSFNGTASTNALGGFHLDPDGKYSGTTTGPGKAVSFFLYFNGRVTTEGNILPNTQNSTSTYNPVPAWDPPWFSWD